MKLDNKELSLVVGGTVSAAFLTAVLNISKTLFDIGVQIGRNIRRLVWG